MCASSADRFLTRLVATRRDEGGSSGGNEEEEEEERWSGLVAGVVDALRLVEQVSVEEGGGGGENCANRARLAPASASVMTRDRRSSALLLRPEPANVSSSSGLPASLLLCSPSSLSAAAEAEAVVSVLTSAIVPRSRVTMACWPPALPLPPPFIGAAIACWFCCWL